jgi:hypothetical protein
MAQIFIACGVQAAMASAQDIHVDLILDDQGIASITNTTELDIPWPPLQTLTAAGNSG